MAGEHQYGVFQWRADNRYAWDEAIRTYASQRVAQNAADRMNAKGEHGGNLVVRPRGLIHETRARSNPHGLSTVRGKRRHRVARKGRKVRRVSARSVSRVRGKRNPGRGDILIGEVHEIRYRHVSEGQRYHTFGPGVKMYGRPDGSILIRHPRLRSWDMEDNL